MPTAPSCPRTIFLNDDSLRKSPILDCVGIFCVGMALSRNCVMLGNFVVNDEMSGDKQSDDRKERAKLKTREIYVRERKSVFLTLLKILLLEK